MRLSWINRLPLAQAACLFLVVTATVSAGPFRLRPKNTIPDELASIARVREVSLFINPLPPTVVRSGLSQSDLHDKLKQLIEPFGFEIASDEVLPMLVFSLAVAKDPTMPDLLGYTMYLDLKQRAKVYRLRKDLVVPTATLAVNGVAKSNNLTETIEKHLERTIKQFADMEQRATNHVLAMNQQSGPASETRSEQDLRERIADERASMANLGKINLEFSALHPILVDNHGLSKRELLADANEQLQSAGFDVVKNDMLPTVVLTIGIANDKLFPNVFSYTVYADLKQQVRIYRLNKDLVVPTATAAANGITKDSDLATRITLGLQRTIRRFTEMHQQATSDAQAAR